MRKKEKKKGNSISRERGEGIILEIRYHERKRAKFELKP